jgi:hypothetical protein
MGLLNRIFGTPEHDGTSSLGSRASSPDQETYALERYRYMLQTAPPETIEQAHAEAFQRLTPEQRQQVLSELVRAAPPHERGGIQKTPYDDPAALARAATRAEVRQPGFMERTLGASPGAGFGAGLLGTFAAGFAGSMVANSFFASLGSGFAGPDEPRTIDERDTDVGGLVNSDGGDFDSDAFDGADMDL